MKGARMIGGGVRLLGINIYFNSISSLDGTILPSYARWDIHKHRGGRNVCGKLSKGKTYNFLQWESQASRAVNYRVHILTYSYSRLKPGSIEVFANS